MRTVKAGSTSVILDDILIFDTTSTTGEGLPGLAFDTAGLTCYYHRNTGNASVAVTLATMTLGTWATGGFKKVDDTNMPGIYSFCPPDAALASGAQSVTFCFQGAANMAPTFVTVELTVNDQQVAGATATALATLQTTANTINTGVNATSIGGSSTAATVLAAMHAGFETGTAQAGAASTITLRAGAVATNDYYKDQVIFISSGTGAGQTNRITGYVGSTKVATVETAWAVQPNNTSVYVVLGRIG